MATHKLDCTIEIEGNFINIIPLEGMKDNSCYEIALKNIKSSETNVIELNNYEIKFFSAMSPMYCNILDVESLLEIIKIDESIVLYNIREASKYARHIFEISNPLEKFNEEYVPFAIKEFTRYKAAKDCLLKIYMSLVTDNVIEGTLGEVKFKLRDQLPDIKKLLSYLDQEIQKWLDAIRGYEIEGRAKMKTAVRGYNHGGYNPRTAQDKRVTPKPVPVNLERGTY